MNSNEKIVFDLLSRQNYRILTSGWPDFLCIKKNYNAQLRTWVDDYSSAVCVEVKAGKDKLSDQQKLCHAILIKLGVPVYTIRADDMHTNKKLARATFLSAGEMQSAYNDLATAQHELRELQNRINQLQATLEDSTALLELSDVMFQPTAAIA